MTTASSSINCYGEKMDEETLLLVEDYLDGKLHVFDQDWPELPFASRDHVGCTVDYVSGRNRYIGYLISLGIYSFKGVQGRPGLRQRFQLEHCQEQFLMLSVQTPTSSTTSPNGLNINLNAGSTHIEGLAEVRRGESPRRRLCLRRRRRPLPLRG